MNKYDLVGIYCKIKNGGDYDTIKSSFDFEVEGHEYEITYEKVKGLVSYFEFQYVGEKENEKD